jgi:hypothetical protein
LDFDRLALEDAQAFRKTRPYPWLAAEGMLTDAGYRDLVATLPPVSMFKKLFGVRRAHGQQSHDRYVLEYREGLALSPAWHAFVEEIQGDAYARFLRRMFGRGRLRLTLHWHYTPNGCSVSPHCDAVHKLGSHIFYFNTEQDWQPEWGGDTLVLDDEGRFGRRSAPKFEQFEKAYSAPSIGNRSLLFQREDKSWHGVREIRCPEGAMRKVFIVVINDRALMFAQKTAAWFKGKRAAAGY